jgi:hypothetical protein
MLSAQAAKRSRAIFTVLFTDQGFAFDQQHSAADLSILTAERASNFCGQSFGAGPPVVARGATVTATKPTCAADV